MRGIEVESFFKAFLGPILRKVYSHLCCLKYTQYTFFMGQKHFENFFRRNLFYGETLLTIQEMYKLSSSV